MDVRAERSSSEWIHEKAQERSDQACQYEAPTLEDSPLRAILLLSLVPALV